MIDHKGELTLCHGVILAGRCDKKRLMPRFLWGVCLKVWVKRMSSLRIGLGKGGKSGMLVKCRCSVAIFWGFLAASLASFCFEKIHIGNSILPLYRNRQVSFVSISLCPLCFLLGSKPRKDNNLPPWRNPLKTSNILPINDIVPYLGMVPIWPLNPTKVALQHLATLFINNLL